MLDRVRRAVFFRGTELAGAALSGCKHHGRCNRKERGGMSGMQTLIQPMVEWIPWMKRHKRSKAHTASHLLSLDRHSIGVNVATRRYLLYAVLPLWLGAGFADYLFHRRTHIERTSGAHESVIHLMMMAETGIPLLMGLFLEINALVLAMMGALFVAHEATAYWDVNYAETRRTVTPNEQHAHSFLEWFLSWRFR
jgi:hypothetical protein